MIKLVRLKNNKNKFYIKSNIVFEFGMPVNIWTGIKDQKVYNTNELIFIEK